MPAPVPVVVPRAALAPALVPARVPARVPAVAPSPLHRNGQTSGRRTAPAERSVPNGAGAESGPSEAGAGGGAGFRTAGSGNTDDWVVRPGDDLWSIAEATLARAWGHPPAEADLARYWWRLVQTNRADLPDPADPSLLFPGDRIAIPPPPAAPG